METSDGSPSFESPKKLSLESEDEILSQSSSPENSENSEESSDSENSKNKQSKDLKKVNQLTNLFQFINRIRNYNWMYYHTIGSYIQKNKYIRYLILFQLYILFGISVYYSSKRTSAFMSPYIMNNDYYRRIRDVTMD